MGKCRDQGPHVFGAVGYFWGQLVILIGRSVEILIFLSLLFRCGGIKRARHVKAGGHFLHRLHEADANPRPQTDEACET